MSIAGGLPLAVERARVHRCDALQIFTKSSNQWRARTLPPAEIAEFRDKVERASISPVVAHASYLINLATAEPVLRERSILAFGVEIDRAEALGLLGVVIHPGSYTTGTEDEGIRLVADGVRQVLRARPRGRALVILEHTAGQGTSLGWRFEQLARMIEHLDGHPRVGVCLDTCHLWGAGYDLASEAGYQSDVRRVRAAGRARPAPRLSRQRFEEAARQPARSARAHRPGDDWPRRRSGGWSTTRGSTSLPMILETPKTEGRGPTSVAKDPLDVRNLRTLRALMARTRERRR